MPRPKYLITQVDYRNAVRYLDQKVTEAGWIGGGPRRQANAAAKYDERKKGLDNINAWAEQWLSSENWVQLKNAVRAARKRASTSVRDKPKNVTLSREAHTILSELADVEGLTMSEFIVRKHKQKWLNTHNPQRYTRKRDAVTKKKR